MKHLKFLFGLGISTLFLFLTVHNLNWTAVGESFGKVILVLLLPAVLVHLFSFWVRSVRWRVMLVHLKPIPTKRLFPNLAISYMANNTLPMRAGEFIRAYLLGQSEGISKTASFSSVILERVLDGITLLFFLGLVLLTAPLPNWAKQMGLLAMVVFLGALAFMFGLVFARIATLSLVARTFQWLPSQWGKRLEQTLSRFLSGLDVLKDKKGIFLLMAWSLMVWALEGTAIFLVANACVLIIPWTAVLFTLVVINFGTMIPASPGYVGTFEFFCVKALAAFGVLAAPAMGFALVLHLMQFIPITLIGLFYFVRYSVSLRSVALEEGVLS